METQTSPGAAGMPLRGLKPASVLAEKREHGDRLRYIAGCRCLPCKRANSAYEAQRKIARAAGDWNGLVPAAPARSHIEQMAKIGIGRRSVAAASDVAESILSLIKSGTKTQIRARTERAILAVTEGAAADSALVPAKDTWKLINRLLKDGHTKTSLAHRLGGKSPALQVKKDFVTVRTAHQVERLYAQLRSTCAKRTMALIEGLKGDGYTMRQIEQRLAALATAAGEETPTLEARNGRIAARTATLVERLYQQMTS